MFTLLVLMFLAPFGAVAFDNFEPQLFFTWGLGDFSILIDDRSDATYAWLFFGWEASVDASVPAPKPVLTDTPWTKPIFRSEKAATGPVSKLGSTCAAYTTLTTALLKEVKDKIPTYVIDTTTIPIYFKSSGLRDKKDSDVSDAIKCVREALSSSGFAFKKSRVSVLSYTEEAYYTWYFTNWVWTAGGYSNKAANKAAENTNRGDYGVLTIEPGFQSYTYTSRLPLKDNTWLNVVNGEQTLLFNYGWSSLGSSTFLTKFFDKWDGAADNPCWAPQVTYTINAKTIKGLGDITKCKELIYSLGVLQKAPVLGDSKTTSVNGAYVPTIISAAIQKKTITDYHTIVTGAYLDYLWQDGLDQDNFETGTAWTPTAYGVINKKWCDADTHWANTDDKNSENANRCLLSTIASTLLADSIGFPSTGNFFIGEDSLFFKKPLTGLTAFNDITFKYGSDYTWQYGSVLYEGDLRASVASVKNEIPATITNDIIAILWNSGAGTTGRFYRYIKDATLDFPVVEVIQDKRDLAKIADWVVTDNSALLGASADQVEAAVKKIVAGDTPAVISSLITKLDATVLSSGYIYVYGGANWFSASEANYLSVVSNLFNKFKDTDVSGLKYTTKVANALSGIEKSAYEWLSVNTAYGKINPKDQASQTTYGVLGLTSDYATITFVPSTFARDHGLLLTLNNFNVPLYSNSFASVNYGFEGFSNARIKKLLDEQIANPTKLDLKDVCTPPGLTITFQRQEVGSSVRTGAGTYSDCKTFIQDTLATSYIKDVEPLNKLLVSTRPTIAGDAQFILLGASFTVVADILKIQNKTMTVSEYTAAVDKLCKTKLEQRGELNNNGVLSDPPVEMDYCFLASYVGVLLETVHKLPATAKINFLNTTSTPVSWQHGAAVYAAASRHNAFLRKSYTPLLDYPDILEITQELQKDGPPALGTFKKIENIFRTDPAVTATGVAIKTENSADYGSWVITLATPASLTDADLDRLMTRIESRAREYCTATLKKGDPCLSVIGKWQRIGKEANAGGKKAIDIRLDIRSARFIDECVRYNIKLNGVDLYDHRDLAKVCNDQIHKRNIVCDGGYYATGKDGLDPDLKTDITLAWPQVFSGCLLISQCEKFKDWQGKEHVINCTSPVGDKVNQRKIYCESGYYAEPPAQGFIILSDATPFPGCKDIDECLAYGFGNDPNVLECKQPADVLNTRIVKCKPGFIVKGTTNDTSATLLTNAPFPGCVDQNDCVIYKDEWSPAFDTLIKCQQTTEPDGYQITCPDGFYALDNPLRQTIIVGRAGYTGNNASGTVRPAFGGCTQIDYCNLANTKDLERDFVSSCYVISPRRVVTCQPGYATNLNTLARSVTLLKDARFTGCLDIDECKVYQPSSEFSSKNIAKCENLPNARNVICKPGYYAAPPVAPSTRIEGGAKYAGCTKIDMCDVYGNSGKPEGIKSCTNSAVNKRTITCNDGFYVVGKSQTTKFVTLDGSAAFPGCQNIDECKTYTKAKAHNVGQCIDGIASVTLVCLPGYKIGESSSQSGVKNPNSFSGCKDQNECTALLDNCTRPDSCINTPVGSFSCCGVGSFTPGDNKCYTDLPATTVSTRVLSSTFAVAAKYRLGQALDASPVNIKDASSFGVTIVFPLPLGTSVKPSIPIICDFLARHSGVTTCIPTSFTKSTSAKTSTWTVVISTVPVNFAISAEDMRKLIGSIDLKKVFAGDNNFKPQTSSLDVSGNNIQINVVYSDTLAASAVDSYLSGVAQVIRTAVQKACTDAGNAKSTCDSLTVSFLIGNKKRANKTVSVQFIITSPASAVPAPPAPRPTLPQIPVAGPLEPTSQMSQVTISVATLLLSVLLAALF